ncbi:MAG: TetR/AcrR family transcriptional regulator [Sphaerochaetaceae bacterium]|nr:TetR/AcrR family transcriptional regulator [Sphaerochaetaceae bacterium]
MSESTRLKILKVAFDEFLEKGFEEASLRNIAKLSKVSTGAIYGYFTSKSDIFDTLVKDTSEELYKLMEINIQEFFEGDIENQISNLGNNSENMIYPLIDYIYAHYNEFYLIFLKSQGTKYQYYIERFVDLEIKNTIVFVDYLFQAGKIKKRPTNTIIAILSENSILAIFKVLSLGLPIEQAKEQVEYISNFYYSGWIDIINQ